MARLKALPWNAPARGLIGQLLARQVHAVLLHGAAGIGKLDLALDTAESLLCEERRPDGTACGQCAGCALTAAGNHPDLRIVRPDALAEPDPRGASGTAGEAGDVRPASGGAESKGRASREIRIEQVRDLSEWVTLTTHRGGPRVIVIEPTESMNLPACNALLKVLEEPPARTIFLLVSNRVEETLPTLRSRCALIRVALPPMAAAVAWLEQQGVAQARQRLLEAGGAPLVAAHAERNGLPPELRDRLLALLRKGAQLTSAEVVATVPREAPLAGSVALFQRWGWDFLAFSLANTVRYHPDEIAAMRQLAATWKVTQACGWLAELRIARSFADHPLNAKLAIEGMLLSYVGSIHGT
ncbi:MAG TPA: DNA polymerase III subunit delta' [Burkholderiaceae bacterium]|nr:DNA polymerase III subunit delta' [Burkholderiaceae bacterium]